MKNLLLTLTLLTAVSPVCAGIFHETDSEHTRVTGRRKHPFHGKSKKDRRAEREGKTKTKTKTKTK